MNGKIINDPVYGFIHFPEKELMELITHPWFQRLRRIRQMGTAHYVYPGAVHTRLHHSLGAAHLMGLALSSLRKKGIQVSDKECISARQAILLHDIGHGPFSHALEYTIVHGITHEEISRLIMARLDEICDGQLQEAISIFDNNHAKNFLHQLVSSQLDMDRMDYLNRDSFYSGVSEGVIGYDRILEMLTVHNGGLAVEEKGIHSVEKFIIARRLMYWQVYLHKTVLGSEQLVIKILTRAKKLAQQGLNLFATPALKFFLYEHVSGDDFVHQHDVLSRFCELDDDDIMASIKVWATCSDKILSRLCLMLLQRRLYKVRLSTKPLDNVFEQMIRRAHGASISEEELPYYLFKGTTSNSTYNKDDDRIHILMKSGELVNISNVDNALISPQLTVPVKKFYICHIPELNT